MQFAAQQQRWYPVSNKHESSRALFVSPVSSDHSWLHTRGRSAECKGAIFMLLFIRPELLTLLSKHLLLFILEIGTLPGEKYKPIWGEPASGKSASSLLLEVTSFISSIISIFIKQLQRYFLFKSPLCHPRAVDKAPVIKSPSACIEVKRAGV